MRITPEVSGATALKRVEDELAAKIECHAVIFRLVGDGLIITNAEGKVISISKVAETLTGWKENESIGKPLSGIFNVVNEKDRTHCEDPVKLIWETGGMSSFPVNMILISRDGTERIITNSGAPIFDRDSNIIGVALAFRDVTKERRMEASLIKLNKLESIVTFARGIVHDFSKTLALILGNISFIKLYSKPGDMFFDRLAIVEKASVMAGELAQQLFNFSGDNPPTLEPTSIAELLKETASFALNGSNVRCEFFMPDNLWTVKIDVGQMSQVIMNLIINANQAMPQGGIIEIRAENATVDAKYDLPLECGNYIKISIKDRGIGIPEEHLQKIFNLYFTTKQEGDGLGLAIVNSIVDNHGGYITANSRMGYGTTFHIYLPAFPEIIPIEKSEEEKLFMGKGKILVMDDDEMIRELSCVMLDRIGYEAATAREGAEAITLYKEAQESGQPFDAVILDFTISSGMGGKEAIQELLEIDPEIKAIISSGYSNDPIMSNFREYGFSGVIPKPCKITELSEIVSNVIGNNCRS